MSMMKNQRTTVTITPEEAETAQQITYQGSPEAIALHDLTGKVLGKTSSNSSVIHALAAAGIRAIREKVLESAYDRAAEFDRADPEAQEWRQAMRARRRRGAAAA